MWYNNFLSWGEVFKTFLTPLYSVDLNKELHIMCVLFRFKTKRCQLLKRMKEKQYFSRDVSENRENENFLQAKKQKKLFL